MLRNLIFGLACLAAAAGKPLAAEPGAEGADDTAAVLALGELGAQMELRDGRIVSLRLEGERIDDGSLQLLARLSFLKSLTLVGANVSGEGLAHLEKLPGLHTLAIEDTPIGDRDVRSLAAIQNVSSYVLRGTRISGMGKQRLEALLEKDDREAAIAFHRGGFLGVSGSFAGEECLVTGVVPESAAAAAGIQAGDVIVEFDGQEITNFQSLAEAVALTPPQAAVTAVVRRGGEKQVKTVTLARGQPPSQP